MTTLVRDVRVAGSGGVDIGLPVIGDAVGAMLAPFTILITVLTVCTSAPVLTLLMGVGGYGRYFDRDRSTLRAL